MGGWFVSCRYEEARVVQLEVQPRELCTASTLIAIASIHVEMIDRNRTIRSGVFAEQPEAYGPSLDCLMHALEIYEARLGPHHLSCVRTTFALGEVCAQQRNHTQAIEFFQRALKVLRSDELDGLSERQDHDEAHAITSAATAQTMLCQAMLATPQAVLRQLNRRPNVMIDATPAYNEAASSSPPLAVDLPDTITTPSDDEQLSASQNVTSTIDETVEPTVDFSGVYRFVALQDGWPRFETVKGKQLFHTSDGHWCIREPKATDQGISSTETSQTKIVDKDAGGSEAHQLEQPENQPRNYQLSVLAVDGLLPEGSCAWRLEHFDQQEGDKSRQVTTSRKSNGNNHSIRWWTCTPQKELKQEEQVLTRLTIPAALTQLVVGVHVQVQHQLTRYNHWSGKDDLIAEGTVGLIVEVRFKWQSPLILIAFMPVPCWLFRDRKLTAGCTV